MQNLNQNDLVSYSQNSGGLQVGNCTFDYPYYWDTHNHYYHNWYPLSPIISEKSKVEQGFKIVAKMIENKIITKELTIKEFIKLVNDIAEII